MYFTYASRTIVSRIQGTVIGLGNVFFVSSYVCMIFQFAYTRDVSDSQDERCKFNPIQDDNILLIIYKHYYNFVSGTKFQVIKHLGAILKSVIRKPHRYHVTEPTITPLQTMYVTHLIMLQWSYTACSLKQVNWVCTKQAVPVSSIYTISRAR